VARSSVPRIALQMQMYIAALAVVRATD
jgi:hypothetical protein